MANIFRCILYVVLYVGVSGSAWTRDVSDEYLSDITNSSDEGAESADEVRAFKRHAAPKKDARLPPTTGNSVLDSNRAMKKQPSYQTKIEDELVLEDLEMDEPSYAQSKKVVDSNDQKMYRSDQKERKLPGEHCNRKSQNKNTTPDTHYHYKPSRYGKTSHVNRKYDGV